MTGAYFRDRTGLCVCLVPACDWKYFIPPALGLGPEESVEFAHRLIKGHRETVHPYLQLQVQKCPLRGCAWEDSTWSVPGITYRQDTHRLQKNWSKHMTHDHPSVRGPGTIQVTARLFPYGVPSSDNRVIAEDATITLPEGGIPVVSVRGELVGRVQETHLEDGWLIAEGFLREDLVSDIDRADLWRGRTLPISFAIREAITIPVADQLVTRGGTLTEVRVNDSDVTVWEGTGLRATSGRQDGYETDEEPSAEGGNHALGLTQPDRESLEAAIQGVSASLQPLRDALEAWAAAMTPAVQALAQALAQHARAVAVLPEPMVVKVAEAAEADFVLGDPPVSRYTCTCSGLPVPHVPGGPQCLRRPPSERQWDSLYRAVPESPDGPEDWPRLPRNGKRAPTGCEHCEAQPDQRHPAGCPGA